MKLFLFYGADCMLLFIFCSHSNAKAKTRRSLSCFFSTNKSRRSHVRYKIAKDALELLLSFFVCPIIKKEKGLKTFLNQRQFNMDSYCDRIKHDAKLLAKEVFPKKALELDTLINVRFANAKSEASHSRIGSG